MSSIFGIILRRIVLGVLTLFVVSLLIFASVNMLPGDFAQAILGQGATPEAVESIREDLGLNKHPVQRYLDWLGGIIQGDFGVSFAQANFAEYGGTSVELGGIASVADQLAPRFKNTMFLAGVSAAISVPLSVMLGILAALYSNSVFDRAINISTLSSISSPEFFLAYILILFLAVLNPIFPSLSNVYEGMTFWDKLDRTM